MNRGLPKALLLDLDDTILNDSGNVAACWQQACAVHQSEYPGVDPAVLCEAIDRVRESYWADPERHRLGRLDLSAARCEVVELSLGEVGVEAQGVAAKIAETYGLAREAGIELFVGAIETLEWLRSRGCKLALLTNGAASPQRRKVERFCLSDLFEQIPISSGS